LVFDKKQIIVTNIFCKVDEAKASEGLRLGVERKLRLRCKAAIFNLINTLIYWKSMFNVKMACRLLHRHGYRVCESEFDEALRHTLFVSHVKQELKSYRDMVVQTCAFLRLNVDKSLLEDMVNSYKTRDRLELYSDVAFALKRLKGMGLKISVVTSTPKFLFENAIVPIKKYVDVVVTSWEAKAVKPEPKIFRKALERLQVKPEDVVVIGDSERLDIQPARKLGMTTVLVDRRGKIRQHSADFKVRNLMQVVRLFHDEAAFELQR